jgi:large subunit ribosomal protein L13
LPREIHLSNHSASRGAALLFFFGGDGGQGQDNKQDDGAKWNAHYSNYKQLRCHSRPANTSFSQQEQAVDTAPHARNFRALSALMKTFSAKANEVPRKWWVIDANNQILGQVAVKAANLLRGKEKVIYTTHVDTGDFVVVINAEKVRLSGRKEDQKSFMSFSGFVGGHKTENAKARRARHPELLVERAIRGMIPHNKLGRAVYRKLKVYRGDLHPHSAQQPVAVSL